MKVVRCVNGSLYDVIVDLRPDSATFGKNFGAELSAGNRRMMYVPRGFAHGFVTIEPDTEILYLIGAFYLPEHERGIRYNDPWLAIDWPIPPAEISDKDRAWPLFDPQFHGVEASRGIR